MRGSRTEARSRPARRGMRSRRDGPPSSPTPRLGLPCAGQRDAARDLPGSVALRGASPTELDARHAVSRQAVSKHLSIFEEASLVQPSARGRRSATARRPNRSARPSSGSPTWVASGATDSSGSAGRSTTERGWPTARRCRRPARRPGRGSRPRPSDPRRVLRGPPPTGSTGCPGRSGRRPAAAPRRGDEPGPR